MIRHLLPHTFFEATGCTKENVTCTSCTISSRFAQATGMGGASSCTSSEITCSSGNVIAQGLLCSVFFSLMCG